MNRQLLKAMAFLAVPAVVLTASPMAFAEPFFQEDPAGIMQDFPEPPENGFDFAPQGFSAGPDTPDNRLAQVQAGTRREQSREGRREALMNRAGITPEQKQALQAIQQQGKSQNQALQSKIQAKRQALMNYMESPDANEAQARSMMNELHNLQKQASDLRLKTFFQMRAKLTPEQRQQLKNMHGGMKSSHGEGGPRRFQGGEGGQRRFQPTGEGGQRRFQPNGDGGQRRFQPGARRFQNAGPQNQ